ncbi:RidA family protein [Pelagibacteraceae bacterium]|nr:RidA family protein [Pelagibacteraceae bacterium]
MKIDFINTPSPIGNFVNVRVTNNYAYISGQGAFDDSGNLITGKVGRDLNIDQAYDAARRVGVTILSVIKNDIGLDRIIKVVKILGLVNCTEDFIYQPKVINGCSDLLVEFFGKEKGVHARSAMGVYMLPNNIPVEIEAILELSK